MTSHEFKAAITRSLELARTLPDDALVFMTYPEHTGIYAMDKATLDQARAGGCETCSFLGLWADTWPGFPPTPHGLIFLYEDGIRKLAAVPPDHQFAMVQSQEGVLVANTLDVLTHEMGHALQRDHVLDGLEEMKAGGYFVSGRGMIGWPQQAVRGCGQCPSAWARR